MGFEPPRVRPQGRVPGQDWVASHSAFNSRSFPLRKATIEDVPRLKTVLAEAFFDDPILSWLMPEDGKRLARLRRYFGIELRHLALARGRVWTTSDLTRIVQ